MLLLLSTRIYKQLIKQITIFAFMFKSKKLLAGLIITFSILLATFSFYFYQVVKTPNLQLDKKDTYLYIPTGANYQTVLDSLKKKDVVHDQMSFQFLAKLLDYPETVKPGKYLIKKNTGNREALLMLRAGRQTPVKLTFNNIRLKDELSGKLCKYLEADSSRFNQLINDVNVVKGYGFDTTTIMCMFLPNTYEMYWNTSAEKLLERMHKEYNDFWTEERKKKANSLGFTPVQVSVLASIVQAEQAQKADERPKVAGLYINRLKTGMPLQADPTLVFGLKNFGLKRILKVHMEVDSPYNTYKYTGLPPGPINLPSISSLNAVLNHEKHDYLYMCAKEDFSGYHNFANNFEDHLKNARLYQKALNAANIR